MDTKPFEEVIRRLYCNFLYVEPFLYHYKMQVKEYLLHGKRNLFAIE